METIYRAKDGMEFKSANEALRHEEILDNGELKTIKDNLSVYISNKSRLKAGILKRDVKKLENAWKEWLEVIPKTRFEIAKPNVSKKIYDALYHLEEASLKYDLDLKKLKEAKEMIPLLNSAIKSFSENSDCSDNLLRKVTRVNDW